MRRLVVTALLVPLSAHACPDMAGTYECTHETGPKSTATISQSTKDEMTIVVLDGQEFLTDGVPRPTPGTDSLKESKTSAWCEGNKQFVFEVTGEIHKDGSYVGRISSIARWSKTSTGLSQVVESRAVLAKNKVVSPKPSKANCVRKG